MFQFDIGNLHHTLVEKLFPKHNCSIFNMNKARSEVIYGNENEKYDWL